MINDGVHMPQDRALSEITGVYVDEVEVQTPPYDDPGAIQEFVGFGATKEFFLEPASSVTKGRINDLLDTWSDKLKTGRFRLKYTLLVRARHKRGARSKARAYVRASNPFEPNVINVRNISETTRHSDLVSDIGPLSEFHDVTVITSK